MVGVPGKSNACINCRKRKKKCDLVRPACSQCLRLRLTCEGYGRPAIFVNSTTQQASDGTFLFQAATYTGNRPVSTAPKQREGCKASQPNRPILLLPDDLARSAFEEKVVGNFWSSYLPYGRAVPVKAIQFSNYNWTNVAHQLYTKSPLIRLALLADAIGMMGRSANNTPMLHKSQQLYGKSLLLVGQSLRDPTREEAHVVLTALKLLTFHEIWFGAHGEQAPDQFKRWATHVKGITAYILSRGPQAFTHGYNHKLFLDMRASEALVGIQLRRSTPLAEPEWKTIPWSENKKGPKDTLIDIFVEFPSICEEADAIRACKDEDEQMRRQKLLSLRRWSVSIDLKTWAANCGQGILQFAESKIAQENLQYSPYTSFEEFAKGQLALQYWASCLILYDPSIYPLNALSDESDPLEYCRKMARFIPFFIGPNGGSDFNVSIFPAAAALRYVSRMVDESDEKLFLVQTFKNFLGKGVAGMINSYNSFEDSEGGGASQAQKS